MLFQNEWSNRDISDQTTQNIHSESILERLVSAPVRNIGGLQVGISCTVNSIPTDLSTSLNNFRWRTRAMYKYPLAKLDTKIVIIPLKSLYTLHIIRIHINIMYGSPYTQCDFTKSVRHLSKTDRWATMYQVQYGFFHRNRPSCHKFLAALNNYPCFP
jgi:hypothetical protein